MRCIQSWAVVCVWHTVHVEQREVDCEPEGRVISKQGRWNRAGGSGFGAWECEAGARRAKRTATEYTADAWESPSRNDG